jgi:hypothetical protein
MERESEDRSIGSFACRRYPTAGIPMATVRQPQLQKIEDRRIAPLTVQLNLPDLPELFF